MMITRCFTEENREIFMKIKDAYKILIDDKKRADYNNKIGNIFPNFSILFGA